ncbi:MAG: hypothetical protein R3C16_06555 [Hyphomonadaceae bacterium]
MAAMIDRATKDAKQSEAARIVFSWLRLDPLRCGVWYLQQQAIEGASARRCSAMRGRVRR